MKKRPELVVHGEFQFIFRPTGWQIPPHNHALPQVLQTMIYFPSEGFQPQQGTYLYKTPWWRRVSVDRQKTENVAIPLSKAGRAVLMPFAHNALISWLNTPRAFHGTIDRPGDPHRRYMFFPHVIDASLVA